MIKALGYSKGSKAKSYPQWNTKAPKRKERDSDTMDVNRAQLLLQERE
jgi:hypothetical protein